VNGTLVARPARTTFEFLCRRGSARAKGEGRPGLPRSRWQAVANGAAAVAYPAVMSMSTGYFIERECCSVDLRPSNGQYQLEAPALVQGGSVGSSSR
jgi:hypothetical protein